jgi:hypothetical protein
MCDPIAGAIIWAWQIERQSLIYTKRPVGYPELMLTEMDASLLKAGIELKHLSSR